MIRFKKCFVFWLLLNFHSARNCDSFHIVGTLPAGITIITNRTLHGCLEKRNFSSRVEFRIFAHKSFLFGCRHLVSLKTQLLRMSNSTFSPGWKIWSGKLHENFQPVWPGLKPPARLAPTGVEISARDEIRPGLKLCSCNRIFRAVFWAIQPGWNFNQGWNSPCNQALKHYH